jgi:LSU ribosomal protein L3P
MPGHMGTARVTVKNLKVIKVDAEKNYLLLKGAVPGHDNGFIVIMKSKKIVKKHVEAPQADKKDAAKEKAKGKK